jgi:hypothetical protein
MAEMTPRENAHAVACDALASEARVLLTMDEPKSTKLPKMKALVKLYYHLIKRADLIDGGGMSSAEEWIDLQEKK